MTLLEHLHRLSRLRTEGLPAFLGNVCLITSSERLPELQGIMDAHPHIKLRGIALLDNPTAAFHSMTLRGREAQLPFLALRSLASYPGLDLAYYAPPQDIYNVTLLWTSQTLAAYGIRNFHIIPSAARDPGGALDPDPNFYKDNHPALDEVYSLLADEHSRDVYAARIKAIITGDTAFMPISPHPDYHHPLVRPEAGDIMVDGGISDMVQAQKTFAGDVGPDGMIMGFEPIPYMCEAAREALRGYRQYQVFCLGLGAEKRQERFTNERDSSHATDATENTILCDMTDLDSFLDERRVRRLNCLKLDVEGSELAALKGAEKTIRRLLPKLIICLYHKYADIFEIPAYIKSIAPQYELYVSHSSLGPLDTVLYARAPK